MYQKEDNYIYAPHSKPNNPNHQQQNNKHAVCTQCGEYGRKTVNIGEWKLRFEKIKNEQSPSNSNTNVKTGVPFVFGAKVSHSKQSSYYEHDNRTCNVECKDIPYAIICIFCGYKEVLFDIPSITVSTSNVVMKAMKAVNDKANNVDYCQPALELENCLNKEQDNIEYMDNMEPTEQQQFLSDCSQTGSATDDDSGCDHIMTMSQILFMFKILLEMEKEIKYSAFINKPHMTRCSGSYSSSDISNELARSNGSASSHSQRDSNGDSNADKNGNDQNGDKNGQNGDRNGRDDRKNNGDKDDKKKKDDDDEDEEEEDEDEEDEDEKEEQKQLITQQMQLIEQQKKLIEQKEKTIQDLIQSNQSWAHSHKRIMQLVQQMKNMLDATVCRKQNISNNINKNKKAKKKKSKSKAASTNNTNSSSYQCDQRIIKIPKELTSGTVNIIKEQIGTTDIYNYMQNTIALQLQDGQIKVGNKHDVKVINLDIHDKENNELLYGVAKKKTSQWRMDPELLTATEIEQKQEQISRTILPQSSRLKFETTISYVISIKSSLFDKLQAASAKCKWQDLPIFGRKNNKRRMILSFTKQEFNQKLQNCIMNNFVVIPIIMFNNDNTTHFLEHILIVPIEKNIYIGISFTFNRINNTNPCENCRFLDNWESYNFITDLKICGNLDDDENRLKNYKQRLGTFKNSLYNVINEAEFDDNETIKQLKLQAEIMIKCDHGSLFNKQKTYTSPSVSAVSETLSNTSASPMSVHSNADSNSTAIAKYQYSIDNNNELSETQYMIL